MWLPLTVLILAGIAQAEHDHGWKVGSEYNYIVRSRTMTTLDKLSDQYIGVLMKALLTVQVKDVNTLNAWITRGQYANIHAELSDGWGMSISDQNLDLIDLPITGKPFEIKVERGVIRDLIVDKSIPTWEVNFVKSVVSQLQVDTLGVNAITGKKNIQVPKDEEPFASFPVMEDSVGGKCEVLYDIQPLSDYVARMKPQLVPLPNLKGDGRHIDIVKTRDFDRCQQRMGYHFGISGSNKWEPGSNKNGQFLSKFSTSRVVISGSLKRFVIQSSVSTSKVAVSPRLYDDQTAIVISRMNVTLASMKTIGKHIPSPADPESTGNLVFVYDNPFSDNEQRRNSVASKQGISSKWNDEFMDFDKERLRNELYPDRHDSSSLSDSEENGFWQPKPSLEDAPQNPLLPHFIGNNGKHVGHSSGNIDVVSAAKDIIFDIANNLETPSEIPEQETLEKFTVLTSLLRTMNKRKLIELENALGINVDELNSEDKSQAVKQNAWAVFRDTVTQAGTGPALLIIKKWIENKDLACMDAADVVTRIPKNARLPTDEYIRTFFELVTGPKVREDKVLRIHAILSFSELVRKAQVNKRTIHNRYPVHAFGRMIAKDDQSVVNVYIPYLEKELKNAISEGNSPMIQTYIVALGGIAHPKILAVFEPFLEGKEKITVFQRTLMVASLHKLTEINPKLAQSVLYKIYLNTMEAHEVRCAAVFLLMKTNPSQSMLQRMAAFTKFDANKHVNSAVKSSILTMTKLTKWGDIAGKARAAATLLNSEDYSYQYSHGFITETVNRMQNLVHNLIVSYIGSDENGDIPSTMYIGSFNEYGGFKTPPTEIVVMLANVNRMIELLYPTDSERSGKLPTEKLAEQLRIIPEETVDVEGNIMFENKFTSRFLPFDARTLRKMFDLSKIHGLDWKKGVNANLNKLSAYEVTLSFPTETGLPLLYTLKVPVLQRMSGKSQLRMDSDKNVNIKIEGRPIYSMKVQGRIGFVAPFERQHFIAGVDMNFQAYLPIRLNMDVNLAKNDAKLRMLPINGEEKAKLIHYSVLPYTSKHDILHLKPVITDRNTQKIRGEGLVRSSKILPFKQDFDFLELQQTSDEAIEDFLKVDEFLGETIAFPWTQKTNHYRMAELFFNLDPNNKEALTISTAWGDLIKQPGENTDSWSKLAKWFAPSNPHSEESRRDDLLKEVGKGIEAARSSVLDLEIQIPGEPRKHSSLTIAVSDSNAETKSKMLVFWKVNRVDDGSMYQACAAVNLESPKDTMPSYEMSQQTSQKETYDVDIRVGTTCEKGVQVNVKGQGLQSEELKALLQKSRAVKNCQEQMKQGNKILRDCLIAAAEAETLDEYSFTVNTESSTISSLVDMILDYLSNSDYLDTEVETVSPRNAGKKTIDFKIKMRPDTTDVAIHSPNMDLLVNNIDTSLLDEDLDDATEPDEDDVLDAKDLCILDKTRIETFDSNSYPLRLGKCWHAIMTTYAKLNPEEQGEKLRIPEENSVSVLVRETAAGRKEVKIMLGKNIILLTPGESEPLVQLDSKELKITQEKGFQQRDEDDEVSWEINRLVDNSISLIADKHGVDIAYDGERILLKASDDYRSSVRGLCGNFDNDATNDFTSPAKCLMRTPELFVATYALIDDQCEGPSKENAKLAKEDCMPITEIWQSNVVSDIDAGRKNTEKFSYQQSSNEQPNEKECIIHRTQVKELDDKICFTTRPVVSCAPGCSPTEIKDKNYQFHCMPKTEAAMNLKKRIEKGANPDLTQKRVDMSNMIRVPLWCKA